MLLLGGVLLAGLLLSLHGSVLRWPFLSDDFIFLSASRSVSQLFSSFDQFPNYFRPIGREIYFFFGYQVFGARPLPFHLLNFVLLWGIVILVVVLGIRLGGPRAGLLAGAAYALLYSHRVLMAWVSCAQDLLATLFALLATRALLSGKRWQVGAWHLAALLSKESVVALPVIHAGWRVLDAPPGTALRDRFGRAAREGAMLWVATAIWGVVVLVVRTLRNAWAVSPSTSVADVSLSAGALWEGMRSALLSYVSLEQPLPLLWAALRDPRQPWLALLTGAACIALIGWLASRLAAPSRGPSGRRDAMLTLGAAWAVLGVLPVALVGHHFSAYYVTFSGAGFAWFVGRLLSASPLPVALAVLLASMTLGLSANRVELFNLTRLDPVGGASYITIRRLDYERMFLDSLQTAIHRVRPARGSVAYVSYAPKYMTFATSENRAPRVWLDDPAFDLQLIGHFTDARQPRPYSFLRFNTTTRGFVQIPNDVMIADLASETAMRSQRPDLARAHVEEALRAFPAHGPTIVRVDLLGNLGSAYVALGDTAEALRSWQAALELDSLAVSPTLGVASIAASRGRLAEARGSLQRLLDRVPDATGAWSLLVRVELARGDQAAARAAWDRLFAIDPAVAQSLRSATQGAAPVQRPAPGR